MSDISNISKLGSATKYNYDTPTPDILETFKNQHTSDIEGFYLVPFTQDRDEFTSLCPKTGQPDFARIEIIYVPKQKMVESKSLKLYLGAFRNSGEFHEDVVNRIANDLSQVLTPYYLRVYGDFAQRGGLAIKPLVERWDDEVVNTPQHYEFIRDLVNSFDIKRSNS